MTGRFVPHSEVSAQLILSTFALSESTSHGSAGWAGSTPDMAQLPELPKEVNRIIKETREDQRAASRILPVSKPRELAS